MERKKEGISAFIQIESYSMNYEVLMKIERKSLLAGSKLFEYFPK